MLKSLRQAGVDLSAVRAAEPNTSQSNDGSVSVGSVEPSVTSTIQPQRRRRRRRSSEEQEDEEGEDDEEEPADGVVDDRRFVDLIAVLPPLPEKGNFNVETIKHSLYFFS